MIDLRYVKKLIDMLDQSTVDSIEISTDKGTKLRIAKSPPMRGGAVQVAAGYAPPAPVAAPAAAPAAAPVAESAPVAEVPKKNLLEIKSPMVGTFYSAPSPDAPPFVSVGQEVTPDTVVCIIEAMKVMNEVKAEVAGTVTEICAENGKPVQFGQAMFRLK